MLARLPFTGEGDEGLSQTIQAQRNLQNSYQEAAVAWELRFTTASRPVRGIIKHAQKGKGVPTKLLEQVELPALKKESKWHLSPSLRPPGPSLPVHPSTGLLVLAHQPNLLPGYFLSSPQGL